MSNRPAAAVLILHRRFQLSALWGLYTKSTRQCRAAAAAATTNQDGWLCAPCSLRSPNPLALHNHAQNVEQAERGQTPCAPITVRMTGIRCAQQNIAFGACHRGRTGVLRVRCLNDWECLFTYELLRFDSSPEQTQTTNTCVLKVTACVRSQGQYNQRAIVSRTQN